MFNSDKKLRILCMKCAAGSKEPAEQAMNLYLFAKGILPNRKIKWDDSIDNKTTSKVE